MGYRTLAAAVKDLEASGQLLRIDQPVSANLEVGAIQRRVFQHGGPALLFTRVEGTPFPLLGNLFGTSARARFLFRDTLRTIERLVTTKVDPSSLLRHPNHLPSILKGACHLLPKYVRKGPILTHTTSLDCLPQLKSWPHDGGAFITLPLVYSEGPASPGVSHSNLGMYRVQISGNTYRPNAEVGLHYQLHRGIAAHHAEAIERGKPLRVNIFIGGPPSLTLAAVMPLPEGMPEVAFAGLLGGHRLPMIRIPGGPAIAAEADFCIVGSIDPHRTLPEGPFGDHLGYYSLTHDFPVMTVERIYHRPDPIWPFTTVGRPPQEDTVFGDLIHELTGPLIATVLPGVHAVHAVDAAGVHPLLLAIGSERYLPYESERQPRELLTQANAILGQGQLSLAKYLMLAAREDDSSLNIRELPRFFSHLLERIDWRRDLHFQTATNIDTLDYSGHGFNQGSKVVMVAAGGIRRALPKALPPNLQLPEGFFDPRIVIPGVLILGGPPSASMRGVPDATLLSFCNYFSTDAPINMYPLIVIVDDADFTARSFDNFVWVTFTRSDPATDVYGIGATTTAKHWGCSGSLVIDARRKPHHAPPLESDPAIETRVDQLGRNGGPLAGII